MVGEETPVIPSLVMGRLCHWTLQDTYYIRPHYQDAESKQLYQIHGNKHGEAAKTVRQRYMAQMKEQIKTPEKELNETDKQSIRCRVQNTVYI